jgi:hypothetical protein
MNQLTNLKSLILIPLALVCFSLAPNVVAKGNPVNCNTSDGFQALFNLTTGTDDTAIGGDALFSNTTGFENTAVGCSALEFNVNGLDNTATGFLALRRNVNGNANTATGVKALENNVDGSSNTATGVQALEKNVEGNNNTATGAQALANNTSGIFNTAFGARALLSNTTAEANTAVGFEALRSNTGIGNIAIGTQAGFHLTTGNGNIDIGNGGVAGDTGTIRIGSAAELAVAATFIAGIFGTPVVGDAVFVNSAGQLGVGGALSSARFKDDIKPMDKTSEAILALKPVTFRYKKELDPKGIPQFGLVAEEVEKVNPDLITRDRDGKPYTVRYEEVNAMLLNEFLKEHRKVEKLEATVAQQQKQIEALTAGLQKVSDKVEMTKPSPQLVADNH